MMTTGTKKPGARNIRSATSRLPSGGAFKIDPNIAPLFVTQLELVCAVEGSATERAALRRRARLLAGLDDEQRRLASVLATGIARLCARGTDLLT